MAMVNEAELMNGATFMYVVRLASCGVCRKATVGAVVVGDGVC